MTIGLESFRIDEHRTEKKFFLLSRPEEDGLYEMELHLESLGGTLLRKSKARGRMRAAELLVAEEDTLGATSVLEV